MELAVRDLDNDTRGWIMCIVSGIACVFGAAIICVDVVVRLLPGKRNFRIQESSVFLACSLSLSFGVMLFSSLYSMLPESKGYLKGAGWTDQAAGFLMMACFVGGFIGIQAISRFLHQYMPSHVVDCDHTHDDNATQDSHSCNHSRRTSRVSRARRRVSRPRSSQKDSHVTENGSSHHPVESTPLLDSDVSDPARVSKRPGSARGEEMSERPISPLVAGRSRATTGDARRPSMYHVQKRVMSFVKDTKCNCDEEGSCYGYTDPCGQECFKHLSTRSSNSSRHPTMLRTTTGPFYPQTGSVFHGGHDHPHFDTSEPISPGFRTSRTTSRDPLEVAEEEMAGERERSCSSMDEGDPEAQHHHHVPTNAFLSIGLQTSIAIALHKFPEGFITFATNHANPTLGFNVFMALFVHNITEGFAMALPLYMALGSRWHAMTWSALLGGLSQPLGAGIAALWFKLAKRTHLTPNSVAYACLFAVTSGIMVSVALQLFVESLSLNHNRNLCIFFGFLGMALLGLSNALFAAH
ncbi:Zinc-regulated transporter 3 [Tolypocladium paradoxum]|uniref:Zinc-regulated transporter 3 n=1 Tax=Tolypocladium paradoxum TaxID=94208 RepID=A0A2S4KZM2_9HYPO|nr:Zinc-regulated transporter 3 [Tolypocladium paradoxum]